MFPNPHPSVSSPRCIYVDARPTLEVKQTLCPFVVLGVPSQVNPPSPLCYVTRSLANLFQTYRGFILSGTVCACCTRRCICVTDTHAHRSGGIQLTIHCCGLEAGNRHNRRGDLAISRQFETTLSTDPSWQISPIFSPDR